MLTLQLSWSQGYSKKESGKIQEFLVDFYNAAIAKDTTQLKAYIFSSEVYSSYDYRSDMIDLILLNNENSQGDFAYSHKAFQEVFEKEVHQFKPIPEQIYNLLYEQPDGIFSEATKGLEYKDIPIFDFKDAHIILIHRNKQYLLVFWENLNNVLKP
jgi:hypothetical protein